MPDNTAKPSSEPRAPTMRAIFIDAKARAVTEIQTTGELEDMYRLIACRTVELIQLLRDLDLWIDEEGAINGTDHGFAFRGSRHPFFYGNGLLLSHDGDGDCVACPVTLEWAKGRVKFLAARPA